MPWPSRQRFQSLWPSLYCFITFRSGLENDPEYAALLNGVAWPEPGSHFLGFDLIGEIGRGGTGRVFLASQPALGERRVVVKVAPQNGREAEILGRLQHANIVLVHSIQEDEASGLTAFCMPYLGQATLAAVLDRCACRLVARRCGAGHPGCRPGGQPRRGPAGVAAARPHLPQRFVRRGGDSPGPAARRGPCARPRATASSIAT